MPRYTLCVNNVYWVYILANRARGALYVGMTNDLAVRMTEHRAGRGSEHAHRYSITRLVFMAPFAEPESAIAFEKRLKRWRRAWKIELIERDNPNWDDLFDLLNA